MKIFVFIPDMPRPRNVLTLVSTPTIADVDAAFAALTPFVASTDVAFDQSSVDDDDPNLMHYVFTPFATFIIAPNHVTDEFVASQFDSTD